MFASKRNQLIPKSLRQQIDVALSREGLAFDDDPTAVNALVNLYYGYRNSYEAVRAGSQGVARLPAQMAASGAESGADRDIGRGDKSSARREPVCFMHIGKVGGHSISLELLKSFALSDAYNASPEQFDVVSPEDLLAKRLIIGHYSYRHTQKLPNGRFLFSLVRNPVDRVISNYWYLRTFGGQPTSTSANMLTLAKSHHLDSFIRLDDLQVRQVVENHQCNFFADDWRSAERSSQSLLDLAISHLDEFDFIGLHERYDDSMQILSAMLGWLPWPSDNKLNVTTERQSTADLAPATLEHLRKLNRLDIALYEEIERRFENRRREILCSLVRNSSLARHAAPDECEPLPSAVDIFADKPFFGEGWHTRTVVSGSYARWIGPRSQATLYAKIDRSSGCELDIYLHGWLPPSEPSNIRVFADGMPCKTKAVHISQDEGPNQQNAALQFVLPASQKHVLELRIITSAPASLAEAGYADEHRRFGTVAIGAFRLRAAKSAEASMSEFNPSISSQPSRDPLESGRQKLMSANGRVSWIVAAEALFREAAEQRPKEAAGHYWRGLSICYQGRGPDAIDHLHKAIKLHEESGGLTGDEYRQAFERLGEGLMLADRLDEAQTMLAKAVKLQSTPEVGQRLNSASYMLDGLTKERGTKSNRRIARWPVKMADFATLEKVIAHATQGIGGAQPLLGPDTRVATLGSCFALNIAHALQRLGLAVYPLGMGELINSTNANRALLEWVTGTESSGIEPGVVNVLRAYFGDSPGEAKRRLQESDVIIFTLGVAPGFFDKQTGLFHLTSPGNNTRHLLAEKEFRTTSVAENVENIEAIVGLIRKLTPSAKVVFTVSPVPIYSTFEYGSAILADCVSKSTLRVAIDAYLKTGVDGATIWPAFEVVRWLGAYNGPMYGAEDGTTRHVSEQVVTAIVEKFVEIHGDDALAATIGLRKASSPILSQ